MIKSSIPLLIGVELVQLCLYHEVASSEKLLRKQINNNSCPENAFFHAMGNSSIYHSKGDVQNMFNRVVPPLSYDFHKGEAGRVGVIGGSEEYTGAPYFAAITALKVGADLSHVICACSASPVIKSYSPELIVHPLLDQENGFSQIEQWLSRLHAVVIGPGLGRDLKILEIVKKIIERLVTNEIPIVIDADGLYLVTQNPSIIQGYKKVILTPNVVEFERLFSSVGLQRDGSRSKTKHIEETVALSKALGDVTIVRKGPTDVIVKGDEVVVVDEVGSPRRCGGQGDLLSGAMNVFLYWAFKYEQQINLRIDPSIVAAYGACVLTRRCALQAFAKHHRSTTTTDLINEIESVFENSKL